MRKITALVAGGLGYVLGARAGRDRYEQIRSMAMRVQNNPKVQDTAHKAADAARDAAPVVKEKVSGAADSATSKGASSTDSSSGPATGTGYPTA